MAQRMDWRRFPVLRERQAIPPSALSALPELAETLPALMNQSQNSLLEDSYQGNHEAGDSQKRDVGLRISDVGLRISVVPGDQSPPVV
jgi:hypothetical protein